MKILLLAVVLQGVREQVVVVADKLVEPFAVDIDKSGVLYVAEMTGQRIKKIEKGAVTVLAGTGEKGDGGDGGPAAQAKLNGVHHIALGPGGQLYVADTWNNRVRKIDPKTGVISPVAGTGKKGFSGDGGPAVKADFGGVYCIAFDAGMENLYVADLDNRRIRKVHLATGIVTTVAGNGQRGAPADGAEAAQAPLVDPRAVAVDGKGNVYVLERSGHALRVVDPAGRIRTVAGTGKKGFEGDGGDARKAALNGPKHLACDAEGNVYVADTENHVIRKYLPGEGKIVRVAGSGKKGSGGAGGPAGRLELSRPHGVFLHTSGVYISDSDNGRVLRVER